MAALALAGRPVHRTPAPQASSCPRASGPRPQRHWATAFHDFTAAVTTAYRALTCPSKTKTMSRV